MDTIKSICSISPANISDNPRLIKELQAIEIAGFKSSAVVGTHGSSNRLFDAKVGASLSSDIVSIPYGPGAGFARRVTQAPVRIGSRAVLRLCPFDIQTLVERGFHDVTPGLTRAAIAQNADLYIAHYVAALPAAARAAAVNGGLYAFDAEDFHPGDLPATPENHLENRLIKAIEARYLPGAAFVTAAAPLIADAYASTYGIPRPTVVLNVFPRSHAPAGPTPVGSATPGPSLYWFSRTVGPRRGLEVAVEGIARATSQPHLYLRGRPEYGYRETLLAHARSHGVAERLHFLEPVSPFELERLGGQYDLGFCGEFDVTVNRGIALTNKLFSYLLSGLPVIASDIAAHRDIQPLVGDAMVNFDMKDPAALAAALDGYLLNPDRLASARAHAWRLGQDRFNWEVERESLTTVIEQVLAAPVRR